MCADIPGQTCKILRPHVAPEVWLQRGAMNACLVPGHGSAKMPRHTPSSTAWCRSTQQTGSWFAVPAKHSLSIHPGPGLFCRAGMPEGGSDGIAPQVAAVMPAQPQHPSTLRGNFCKPYLVNQILLTVPVSLPYLLSRRHNHQTATPSLGSFAPVHLPACLIRHADIGNLGRLSSGPQTQVYLCRPHQQS